jgi:hypothetical protein
MREPDKDERLARSLRLAYGIAHELGCEKHSAPQEALGRRRERRADRAPSRVQPQRGLRQAGPFGPEAWSQAANSKTQDKAGPEAKTSIVGRLHAPGGKEGVAEESREAA